jgi:hypothetical protein
MYFLFQLQMTGTSALLVFRHAIKGSRDRNYSQSFNLVVDALGVRKHAVYTSSDEEMLNELSKDQLSRILQRNNKMVSGKKQDLIQRIISHSIPFEDNNEVRNSGIPLDLTIKLMKVWFMAPFHGNKASYIGQHNEKYVKNELPNFIKKFSRQADKYMKISHITDYGLLYCKNFPRAAFSPDGICVSQETTNINTSSVERQAYASLIEIKTKTTPETVAEEMKIAERRGLYVEVDLSQEGNHKLFVDLIPQLDYRSQILHGLGCGVLRSAYYVVASEDTIIRVVHVRFHRHDTFHVRYQRAIREIFNNEGLHWIDAGNVPKISPDHFKATLKYVVDQHTVDQSFELCKALDLNFIEQGKTIPPCHRCLPASVALWNKCKGPIDNYSQMLRNNYPKQRKLTAIGFTWLRIFRTAVYNAYQMAIIFETKNFLASNDCNSWKVFNEHRSRIRQNENGSLQSLQSFIGSLIEEVTSFLGVGNSNTTTDDEVPKMYKKREVFFSDYNQKKLRRCNPDSHVLTKISRKDDQKQPQHRCVWCCECNHGRKQSKKYHSRKGRKTTNMCGVCKVPLCNQVREGNKYTCFAEWHFAKQLNNPCAPSKRDMSRANSMELSSIDNKSYDESSDELSNKSPPKPRAYKNRSYDESSDESSRKPRFCENELSDELSNESPKKPRAQSVHNSRIENESSGQAPRMPRAYSMDDSSTDKESSDETPREHKVGKENQYSKCTYRKTRSKVKPFGVQSNQRKRRRSRL